MPTEMNVHAVHQGAMRITATAGKYSVEMDYPLQQAEPEAIKPLELLLASLAGCAGNTMAALLRAKKQPFKGLEVHARGLRRDEHPTIFTEISLELTLRGEGLDHDLCARTWALAEKQVCPVWAMLKGGTNISSSMKIVDEKAS
jgi:putative redox protein